MMTQELSRVIERRGEKFEASILAGTRHWGAFLAPLGVKLHGAFTARSGRWAPHSFTFKLRQDLLPRECVGEEAIQPGGSESDLARPTHIHIGQAKLHSPTDFCDVFSLISLHSSRPPPPSGASRPHFVLCLVHLWWGPFFAVTAASVHSVFDIIVWILPVSAPFTHLTLSTHPPFSILAFCVPFKYIHFYFSTLALHPL